MVFRAVKPFRFVNEHGTVLHPGPHPFHLTYEREDGRVRYLHYSFAPLDEQGRQVWVFRETVPFRWEDGEEISEEDKLQIMKDVGEVLLSRDIQVHFLFFYQDSQNA